MFLSVEVKHGHFDSRSNMTIFKWQVSLTMGSGYVLGIVYRFNKSIEK